MLGAFWYVVRNKRPNWKIIIGGVGCLGSCSCLWQPARHRNAETLNDTLSGQLLSEGDEFVSAAAMILASEYNGHHYWGLRVFAIFLVRPIPSFVWETKWQDLGLEWMVSQPGLCGMTTLQWQQAVGFDPALGTAGGFCRRRVSGMVVGGGLRVLWSRILLQLALEEVVAEGGVWTAIYVEAMILSIYLPSQSLGAWAYRFALLSVPTAVLFRLLIPKKSAPRQVIPPMHFPASST